MEMKKVFSLLLLVVSTTAQKCDFLESSIGNDYSIGNAKRQKQNLADIITTRDLGIIDTNNESGILSAYEIKNTLKRKYPALNTDHIQVSIRNYCNNYVVWISSTHSGNYTGSIYLSCTIKQKQKQKQNLRDIITFTDLGIIDTNNESGIPSAYEIKNILKRKYPRLNTDHIQVIPSPNFYNMVWIHSTPSGNYTGNILLNCTIKQKQNNWGGNYQYDFDREFYWSGTSFEENNWGSNYQYDFDKKFGNSSSGQNNKGSTNSSSQCLACNCDQTRLDEAYKILNQEIKTNKITSPKQINSNSSVNDLSRIHRKLSRIYNPNKYKDDERKKVKFKEISSAKTVVDKHFSECQHKTDQTPPQKSNNHKG